MDFLAGNIRTAVAQVLAIGFIFIMLRRSYYASKLLLPGVVLHEFAHLIVGAFLNAKPVSMTLFTPHKANGKLGSVTFNRITKFNAFFTALAPLLLWGLAFYLVKDLEFSIRTLHIFLFAGLLIEAGLPSSTDWKVSLISFEIWISFFGLFFILFLYYS